MAESILFLTGHLARPRLEAVLENMKASFAWKVLDIGVKVAALMTEEIIARRLPKPVEADKIMLPGRCRADLDRLSERFGVPFVRGPDELKDIPGFFGRARCPVRKRMLSAILSRLLTRAAIRRECRCTKLLER